MLGQGPKWNVRLSSIFRLFRLFPTSDTSCPLDPELPEPGRRVMIQYHRRYVEDREVNRRWIDPRLYAVRLADPQTYLLMVCFSILITIGSKPLTAQEQAEPVFDGKSVSQWVELLKNRDAKERW